MTATTVTIPRSAATSQSLTFSKPTPVWRVGAVASVAAAVSTELLATAARAAGVTMRAGDPGAHIAAKIPVLGFALPTLMCAAIGTVLAVVLARRAKRPAHTFTVTTLVLTAISMVSPVFAGATAWTTKSTLVAAHLLAAAIVIPTLARRLGRSGGSLVRTFSTK